MDLRRALENTEHNYIISYLGKYSREIFSGEPKPRLTAWVCVLSPAGFHEKQQHLLATLRSRARAETTILGACLEEEAT